MESHSADLTFRPSLSLSNSNPKPKKRTRRRKLSRENSRKENRWKMCEPDDNTARNGATPPPSRSRELLMDVDDLDLDGSWPLDQIPYLSSSNRMISPLFVSSSSEQPCSPLWAFSDVGRAVNHRGDDEKISSASGVPSFRLADYPLFLPC